MAKAAQHKEKLIQTAAALFREQGYSATGLNEILARSGAPKGSLYYYFPAGKEALAAEAVTFAGNIASNTLQQLRSTTTNASEFTQQYCKLLAGWMMKSNFRSGCPIATTILETCPTSTAIQQASQKVFKQWISIISEVFVDEGFSAKHAHGSALLIISAVEGSLILSRVQSSTKPIDTIAGQLAGLWEIKT